MSQTEGLHKGMVIRHEGQLYALADFHVAQTGKQKPTVHLKLRSLRSGKPVDRTLDQIGGVEEVESEVRQMQYLYAAGDEHVFMDCETYEQFNVGGELLGRHLELLVMEERYSFLVVEGQLLDIQMPTQIAMEIADTSPVEHAGGGSNVHKEAKLACGLTIHVPLFIKTGDRVRIDTEKREYLGKEH